MRPSFAIVGCGRVGTAFGKHLTDVGYRLSGLSCKTKESVKKAAEKFGIKNFSQTSWEITKDADIVFITTPDGVITQVCDQIAQKKGFGSNSIVLHCSGAHPSTILSSAKQCNASIGSMHPLQSFSAESSGNTFKGIIVSTEGDAAAVNAARKMATDLESTLLTIKTEAKILYHAAAVVASNYLVTVQDLALKLIKEAGVSNEDAFKVLNPLIQGTLSNIENVGAIKALTGPIARGDVETVERHIGKIREKTPNMLDLYKILGRYTVDIAAAGETITREQKEDLKRTLE